MPVLHSISSNGLFFVRFLRQIHPTVPQNGYAGNWGFHRNIFSCVQHDILPIRPVVCLVMAFQSSPYIPCCSSCRKRGTLLHLNENSNNTGVFCCHAQCFEELKNQEQFHQNQRMFLLPFQSCIFVQSLLGSHFKHEENGKYYL